MYNKYTKFFTIIFFSLFLFNTSSFSFHKENAKKNGKLIFEDPETTKDQIQQKYCASKIVQKKTDGEQETNEEGKLGWVIYGYHKLKALPAEKKLILSKELNKSNLDFNINYDTTLEKVLKIHCLQYAEERPIKYKKSSMLGLFKQIAEKNNLIDANGNPNIKMPIGEDLFINGITIDIPNVVYYIPDYLIAKYDKYQKKQKKKKDKEKKRKEKAAKDKKWVKDNYSLILKNANKKREKFLSIQSNDLKKVEQLNAKVKEFTENLNNIEKDIEDAIQFDILNKDDREIIENLKLLNDIKNNNLEDIITSTLLLEGDIKSLLGTIKNLFTKKNKSKLKIFQNAKKDYLNLTNAVNQINETISKKSLKKYQQLIKEADIENLNNISSVINDEISEHNKFIKEHNKTIEKARDLINETKLLDVELSEKTSVIEYIIYIGIALLVIFGIGLVVYNMLVQRKELTKIKSESKKSESRFSELQGQIKSTSEQIKNTSRSSPTAPTEEKGTPIVEKPKTQGEILANKFDEMVSDYKDSLEDFSKVAAFKQKWNGLALSRKERQDGTKTILINSTRAFEKAEIWCLNFSDKYFAFPGSSVKSNMAAYMNLDFEKATRDFKGVFAISSGSSFLTDPALLRRGGAGFVVEKPGKLTFPT